MVIKEISKSEFDSFSKTHVLGSFFQSSTYGTLLGKYGYTDMYVGGYNKKYKLMSDIVVDFDQSTLYSDSFLSSIDFNNHAIYTNDDNFFYGYKKWQNKWWYDPSK